MTLFTEGVFRMQGRDFTEANDILFEKALECIESKGEDSIITYDSLFKMYFESIWSVKWVRNRFSLFAEQLNCTKDKQSEALFYQMLFDMITFYNVGNANQLYRIATDEWLVSNVFSVENRMSNNSNLSAFLYTQFFAAMLEELEEKSELTHVMFLNVFLFMAYPEREVNFLNFVRSFTEKEDELGRFYEYALKVSKDFYRGKYMEKNEFIKIMEQEAYYFLSLSESRQEIYLEYIRQVKYIISECAICADRQKNYGLVETDFDCMLECAI